MTNEKTTDDRPAYTRGLASATVPLVIAVVLLATAIALGWEDSNTASQSGEVNLSVLLATYVALATAIERFLEGAFGFYESLALSFGRLIGLGKNALTWTVEEINAARRAAAEMAKNLGDANPTKSDYESRLVQLERAETRLHDARARAREALKAPEYTGMKAAITLIGGLIIGVIIAFSFRLTLLALVGLSVGPNVDHAVTGLLIGAGPGPLHSFINMIQELKNILASKAADVRANALRKVSPSLTNAPLLEHTWTDYAKVSDGYAGELLRVERQANRVLAPR